MFEFSKKKTIIGICGFIISILLASVFMNLSPSGNIADLPISEVIFRILSLLFISSAIGFIAYIFSSIKGFLLIFVSIAGMSFIKILFEFTTKTSPNLTIFIITIITISFFIIASYNCYKTNNVAINGNKALSNKEKKQQEELEKEIAILNKEDEEIKKSIGYIKNSIIISSQTLGRLYQVIKIHNGFLFHHIGNILKGIDQSKLIKDFTNIEIDKNNKNDYILNNEEIIKITATIKNNYAIMDCGNIKISLENGKNKRYGLTNLYEEKELKEFFNNKIEIINKVTQNENNEYNIGDNEKSKMTTLNKFLFIYSIVSSLIFGLYFNIYNKIAHTIIATICIVICIVPFILYVLFPKYISLKDKPRYDTSVQYGKINIIHIVLMFPSIFALFSLIENRLYMHYNILKLLLYSAILFIVLISLLLIFSKEYKKEKSAIVIIIIVCLILSPTIIHKIDTAYDFSPSQEIYCEITDIPTWTDNNNEITYYLTIRYNDKDIKTEVTKETYEKYKVGDKILVLEKQGALGIEKLVLKE